MTLPRGEVLQGTLDLIVLKTLDAMGPLHGYGIAQRVQQVSETSEAESWERMAAVIAKLLGAEGA
jgi:DNA-binding PadR family transcriptional regulator